MFPVLVDDDGADAALFDEAADAPDVAGDQRSQPFGGFVEDEHVGVGHERPADGEHLLLAARQLLAAVAQAFFEAREGLEHTLVGPVALALGAGARCHLQVFHHAQVAENATALGHVGDAQLRHFKRGAAIHALALDVHRARARRHDAHEGFEQGAFAHAVAAHEANRLASADRKVHATQDVARAVIGVQVLGLDQQVAHLNVPRPGKQPAHPHRPAPPQACRSQSLAR